MRQTRRKSRPSGQTPKKMQTRVPAPTFSTQETYHAGGKVQIEVRHIADPQMSRPPAEI